MYRREEVFSHPFPEDSATPLPENLDVVIMTGGYPDRFTLAQVGIDGIAEDVAETGVPVSITIADWGLSAEQARDLRQFIDSRNLKSRFVPVTPTLRSPAHSFNEGVNAIVAQSRAHGEPLPIIVKGDDDSVIAPGVTHLLRDGLRQGYQIVAPQNIRPPDESYSTDPSKREQTRNFYARRGESAHMHQNWKSELFEDDGTVNIGKVWASFSLDGPELTPNENYMAFHPSVTARLARSGSVFNPRRFTGEGQEMAIVAARAGIRIGSIENAFVIDRTLKQSPYQSFEWGTDDMEMLLMLRNLGQLRSGLQIFTQINDRIVHLSLPSDQTNGYEGLVFYPEITAMGLEGLRSDRDTNLFLEEQLHNCRERINRRQPGVFAVPEQRLGNLVNRIEEVTSVAQQIREALGSEIAAHSGDDPFTAMGARIEFPFPGVALREDLFDQDNFNRVSMVHTIAALAAAPDERFVMIQQ